ncbi:MAG: DUF3017 domain-containing protein [Nocardioides sp.]
MTAPLPEPAPEPPPRRMPQTIGGTVYIGVVAAVAVGLVLVVAGAWRTGLVWMGVAVLVGALARSVLSDRAAGMLRVRRRWGDVLLLTLAGVALVVLAVIVPDQQV